MCFCLLLQVAMAMDFTQKTGNTVPGISAQSPREAAKGLGQRVLKCHILAGITVQRP